MVTAATAIGPTFDAEEGDGATRGDSLGREIPKGMVPQPVQALIPRVQVADGTAILAF